MLTKLTQRQQSFISEYAKDHNATQSAIRAGYSPNGARVAGHRLLTNVNTQQGLQAAGLLGFNTLVDIAQNGANEFARVNAAKILVEYSYGKPKTFNYEKDVSVRIKPLVD